MRDCSLFRRLLSPEYTVLVSLNLKIVNDLGSNSEVITVTAINFVFWHVPVGAFSFVITNSTFELFVLKCSQCFNLIVLVPKIRADHDSVMIHFQFLMVCWVMFLSLLGIMSPIYLHWIFPILQLEILNLINWIFSQFDIQFIGLG